MANNIIKKYNLKALKNIGFKKSAGTLGDAYGVVNAYLKEGDTENAETIAATVAITLSETIDKINYLSAIYDAEEAIALLKAELIKEKAFFFEVSAFINND